MTRTLSEAAAPERLVAVSQTEPAAFATILSAGSDPSSFVGRRQGANTVVLLRPTVNGLRLERLEAVETVSWDEVVEVEVTELRLGADPVPCARIRFRSGPSLDLVDGDHASADELPMSIEAAGPVLIRVERLRLLVAAVVASVPLAPRERRLFHRGGRGVPPPEVIPRPGKLPFWAPTLLLVASVGFLVLVIPDMTWFDAIGVTAALLWHEAGHAIALRIAGMRARYLLVLPALGAATVPDRPFESRWADTWVALAGPMTGIPVALFALLALDHPPPEPVQWGLFVAIALGALNLIPVMPLDGGRVLVAMVAGCPSRVRTVVVCLPLAALVVWIAVSGSLASPLGPALLLIFAAFTTRLALRRHAYHDWMLRLCVPPAAVRRALRDVTFAADGVATDERDGGVPPTPLTLPRAAVIVVAYIAVVAALLVASARLAPVLPQMGLDWISGTASGD